MVIGVVFDQYEEVFGGVVCVWECQFVVVVGLFEEVFYFVDYLFWFGFEEQFGKFGVLFGLCGYQVGQGDCFVVVDQLVEVVGDIQQDFFQWCVFGQLEVQGGKLFGVFGFYCFVEQGFFVGEVVVDGEFGNVGF